MVFSIGCEPRVIVEGTSAGLNETSTGAATSAATSTDKTTGAESTANSTTGAGATTTGPGATTGPAETGNTTSAQCGLELDVVFVVGRSAGMLGPQEKLREAYPAFFSALTDAANLDLRVLVTDIDRTPGAEKCEDVLCPQNNDASCAPDDPGYPCAHTYTACDLLFGASVTFPVGIGAANADCGFSPFLSSVDKAALDCALTVGEGTDAVSFGGTLQGLLGPTNAPCNGGFIRDGANLAIIVLANKDDSTFTRPPAWIAETQATRPPGAVAILAITGDTPKISEFTAAFPNALTESIAAPAYTDAMNEAAALTLKSFCP